ncbi:MAG: DUF4386 domain-containing protein [Candidatus Bathyarchaeota archaeon]
MIEIVLSGFFFWFIIVVNIVSGRFGYETFSDLNAKAKLQKIASNPKKFKTSLRFIVVEHFALFALAVVLFFTFGSYSIILAVVWTVSRSLEALIQIYYKKIYWGIANLAKQYSSANDDKKASIVDSARSVLKTKNTVFVFAQLFFSIGTLAYSIVFATQTTVVPDLLGWFGIIASVIYGVGSGVNIFKPDSKAIWNVGGLSILVFELILGGWLLFYPII